MKELHIDTPVVLQVVCVCLLL